MEMRAGGFAPHPFEWFALSGVAFARETALLAGEMAHFPLATLENPL